MATSRKHGWLGRKIFRRAKNVARKTPYGCRLGFESLESRRILSTINWTNQGSGPANDSDGFDATFGPSAAQARLIVGRAILDWEETIVNFHHSGGGNTYSLSVSMGELGDNLRAEGGATARDVDLVPTTGSITLDLDAGGSGWYIDPVIGDDGEFDTIVGPFSATGTITGNDLYRTITHEIGHAVGITQNTFLRLSQFLTNLMVDDPVADDETDPGGLWAFNVNGGLSEATFTGADSGHLYEGPAIADRQDIPIHPNDLMNSGRAATDNNRKLISDLDATVLRDAYGYSVTMPSTLNNFLVNPNFTTDVLTISGYPGTENDVVVVSSAPGGFNVVVSGFSEIVPLSQTDSIVINTGVGTDQVHLTYNAARPTTINGGAGIGDALFLNGGATVNDDTVTSSLIGTVTYSNFDSLILTGTNGNDVYDIVSLGLNTPLSIVLGGGDDTVTLGSSPFASESILSPVTVFGEGGNDTLFLGSNNADSIDANIVFNGGTSVGGVGDRIIFNDTAPSYNVSYNIGPSSVTRDGFNLPRTVSYSSTEGIVINAGSGADTVTLLNAVGPLVTANGNSGNDNFIVGGGNMTGFVPQIFNGGLGIDQITFDDRFDPTNRIWDMRNNEVIFGGLISLFTDGFESVGLLAGTGNDEITFAGTLNQAFDIDAGGGSDVFILGFQGGVLFNSGATSLRGGDASDAFTINDASVGGGTTLALDGGNAFNSMAVNESFPVGFTLGVGYFVSEGNGRFDLANIETQVYNGNANNNVYTILSAGSLFGTITVNGNLGNDTFLVAPQPLGYTFKNLSLNGNQGIDTFTYDASALSNDEGYTIGTNTILIARDSIFSETVTTASMNQITLTGGSGNDTFAVNQYSAGIPVTVNGGFGDDTLDFGNGDVAANITNIAAFLFNGMEGIDTFNLRNANPANSFTYTAAANTTLQVSRTFPSSYFLSLEYYNTEQKVVYAGPAVDIMNITSFASGELSFHGGGGDDALNLPTSSDLLGRRVNFFGDAGTANRINQVANGKTTPSTLHVAQNTIGALPGDDFFASGGSVFFDSVQIIQLRMGSGADTAYVQPDAVAAISIIGGNPTTAPGDTLNLALGGAVNYVVNGTPASGNVTSDNLKTLSYSGFENGPSVDDVAPYIVAQSYDDSVVPTIFVEFSEDVSNALSVSFLELINTTTSEQIAFGLMALSYEAGTNVASFTFPGYPSGVLPAGEYTAGILSSLTDSFGNSLVTTTPFMFTVQPPLAGDYDGDGSVGEADYDVWKSHFGQVVTPGTNGDGNGDGIVDAADYSVWRDNLGAGAGSGAAALTAASESAVPRSQPPALPGVSVREMVVDEWAVGSRSEALTERTLIRPRAEPGATGVFRAAGRAIDGALLAWCAFGDTARADRNGDHSSSRNSTVDDATDDAFFDDTFLDGVVYFKSEVNFESKDAAFQLMGAAN